MSDLPEKLKKTRDAVIDHLISNSPLPAGIEDLQEWLEIEGDLIASWINEDVAFRLKFFANDYFKDEFLIEEMELDDSLKITDDLRLDFARSKILRILQNDDSSEPSVHGFQIQNQNGQTAILGSTVEVAGQAGNYFEWHGVFRTNEEFLNFLRMSGFTLYSEVDQISDLQILSLWKFPKSVKKTKLT
jgi:hypothetical protein